MLVRIRDTEGCEPQPQLLWDTIWMQRLDASGGYGDWILAGPGDQTESLGGLRAESALHTATLLCLFTDARADESDRLPTDDGDRRGWWGDSIRLADEPGVPLGSTIWVEVERGVLDDGIGARVEVRALRALDVLKAQGAVARTTVSSSVDKLAGNLFLVVEHFSRDGRAIYAQRFGVIWGQVRTGAQMNFGDQGAL